MSTGVEATLTKARNAARQGDLAEARRLYAAVLERFPGNAKARRALAELDSAPAGTASAAGEVERLVALYQGGHLAEAVRGAEALLQRNPRSAMLYNIVGAGCIGLKQYEKAEAAYTSAAAIEPNDAEIHNNHGTALSALARLEEAAACFRRALAIRPDYAEAHYNLGNALRRQHALGEAVDCYLKALAIAPGDAECLNNLGLAYRDLGRLDEALAAYGQALEARPDFADALHNLGLLMMDRRDFANAIKAYRLALAIDPEKGDAAGQLLYAMAHACDFSAQAEFDRMLAAGRLQPGQASPFTMLVFADDPALQLAYARAWSEASSPPPAPAPAPAEPRAQGERIRIGYFSADFHDHATMHLMAGLFREHDRERFEIGAYSYGPDSDGELRRRLLGQVDRFVEARALSDAEVSEIARSHCLDIAVDLKGYTQHARSRIFAGRPAPVQVNYLGFPGTMGTACIDYLVADAVVVPPGDEAGYRESIVRLPGCYQPNDDLRPIVESTAGRAKLGLPAEGFVFCCFNHSYKISAREFAIWMRLLARVEGSVLWLLRSNPLAEASLRREAEERGIDPQRLVFAPVLPHHEHLGRLRHADLFLDTFNVNAHTTASDALWAGLPVLTKAGRQFAARVCASLVTAAGLPELVTTSEAAYEEIALRLATEPQLLGRLRERLAAGRGSCALFATRSYTRQLEAAFAAMHARRLAGLAPADISIPDSPLPA